MFTELNHHSIILLLLVSAFRVHIHIQSRVYNLLSCNCDNQQHLTLLWQTLVPSKFKLTTLSIEVSGCHQYLLVLTLCIVFTDLGLLDLKLFFIDMPSGYSIGTILCTSASGPSSLMYFGSLIFNGCTIVLYLVRFHPIWDVFILWL